MQNIFSIVSLLTERSWLIAWESMMSIFCGNSVSLETIASTCQGPSRHDVLLISRYPLTLEICMEKTLVVSLRYRSEMSFPYKLPAGLKTLLLVFPLVASHEKVWDGAVL